MGKTKSPNKAIAKIGLFSSITILISAVVGIGIFFKNKSILNNNDGNGWGVLISWIIATVITLTTALAFAEIISADKKHDGSGLAGWAYKICGHKFGRFVLIVMPLFYFLFKLVDTSFFAGESVLLIFNKPTLNGDGSTTMSIEQGAWVIVLIAYVIMVTFIFVNAISTKAAKGISWVATVCKFTPLILIGFLGIIFGALDGFKNSFFKSTSIAVATTNSSNSSSISVLGIFASLPALLFTFDSFLTIGNAATNMEKPEKQVPKAILIGIPVVAGLYLFVTIGQLLTGQRDVYAFFEYIVRQAHGSETIVTSINIVVGCIIMLSLFGSVNAMTIGAVRSIQSGINNGDIMGSDVFKRLGKNKPLRAGCLYGLIIGTILCGIMAIPTIVLNSDSAYDGVSNLPTLFFFVIYAMVILFGLINHFNHKVEVKRMFIYPVLAVVSILGCMFAFGYNLFYEYFIRCFTDNVNVNWGMFKGQAIDRPIASAIVWVAFIIFVALPFINDFCISKIRKTNNSRLIWQ
ncbi:MAG: APC family permease [Mycoplasmataceae bacterium]|nr:APC family permease [Mycoplasmataceae bacterium]